MSDLIQNQRIVFLHIPKTGGTSVHDVLLKYCRFAGIPPEAHFPERFRFIDGLSDKQLASFRFFSGHYFFDQVERIANPKILLTFLREPRARIVSLYNFLRSYRWSAIDRIELFEQRDSPRKAKELSLVQYLHCSDFVVRIHIDNAIVRHLIGIQYTDREGRITMSDDNALNLGIANLAKFGAVGFLDENKGFLRDLGCLLGFEGFPEVLPRLNEFGSAAGVGVFESVDRCMVNSEAEQRIAYLTRLDCKVYEWARASKQWSSKDTH